MFLLPGELLIAFQFLLVDSFGISHTSLLFLVLEMLLSKKDTELENMSENIGLSCKQVVDLASTVAGLIISLPSKLE